MSETPSQPPSYGRPPSDDEALLAECDVTAFTAGGPGGQHRNRSQTAVRLKHRPTGVVVIGRRERSQRQNLVDALLRLREKLLERTRRPKTRKPTRSTRGAKERRLKQKRRRADVKKQRRKPDPE